MRNERDPETAEERRIQERLLRAAGPLADTARVKVWDYDDRIGVQVRGADGEPIAGSPWERPVAHLRNASELEELARQIEAAAQDHIQSVDRKP